jgi:glycosyltransferase involved in cell wall biosynthesis
LLYQPDNSQALAEAIYKVYKDRDLRIRLEKNARDSVRRFDWLILNRELEAKFRSLYPS